MAKLRQFEVGNYYHSYSRGVNKTKIFLDHSDYLKFIDFLIRFNTTDNTRKKSKIKEKLVDIFCYTLMPNHFHFIFKEISVGGISLYLQKVLGAYSRYFNDKYGRVGALFGERFKDKLVDSDQYFEHLVGYIWNNPIKIINKKYNSRDLFNGKIKLTKKEKDYALNYSYKFFPEGYLGPEHKKLTKTNFEIFDF